MSGTMLRRRGHWADDDRFLQEIVCLRGPESFEIIGRMVKKKLKAGGGKRSEEPGDKPAGGYPLVYPLINRRLRADNDAAAANRARVLMIFARDPRALGRLPFFISLCGNPVRTRRRPSLRERVGHRCTPHR